MPTMPAMNNGIIVAPHVVILGAGASIAAYEDWGRIGEPLPSMADLIDLLELRKDIVAAGFDADGIGFEELYDQIAASKDHVDLRHLLEEKVYAYFSSLLLPDRPTIYDYLVLALREKDLIATYNWDPFLLQAYLRNECVTRDRRPHLSFLHGNVKVAVCETHKITGVIDHCCRECGEKFTPSKLLYPVGHKDYNSDLFIKNEWEQLKGSLDYAYQLTVFGYGAPRTDIEARNIMLESWDNNSTKPLADVEIIDIKNNKELEMNWNVFFHSHHYTIHKNFFDSYLVKHPRRSCDALHAATLMLCPWRNNPFPKFDTLQELQGWVGPLIEEEKEQAKSKTSFSGTPLLPNKTD